MPTPSEVRSNIISLLRSKIGFGVELFGMLSIEEIEGGKYRIYEQRDSSKPIHEGEEYEHKDVKKAVDHFLKLREDMQLGYDFEKPNPVMDLVDELDKIAVVDEKSETVRLDGEIPLELYEQLKRGLKKN